MNGFSSQQSGVSPKSAMPPLSPIHGEGATPDALLSTCRPGLPSPDAEVVRCTRTASLERGSAPRMPHRHSSSAASLLSTGLLPDGFYFYYGSEDDAMDSPGSESCSAYLRSAQANANGGNNNNSGSFASSPAASRRRMSASSSAGMPSPAAGTGVGASAIPYGQGGQNLQTPPRSPQSAGQASLSQPHSAALGSRDNGNGTLANLYNRQASQNSLLSIGAASSRSPRSPQRGDDVDVRLIAMRGGGSHESHDGARHNRNDTPSERGVAISPVVNSTPLDTPAPLSRSPPYKLGGMNDLPGEGKRSAVDVRDGPASHAERRLFETNVVRGVLGAGVTVERHRHNAPVQAHAVVAPNVGERGWAADTRKRKKTAVPMFCISATNPSQLLTNVTPNTASRPDEPVLAVDQLRRHIMHQQIAPRVQSFLNAASPTLETVVLAYEFRHGHSHSVEGAPQAAQVVEACADVLPPHVLLQRVRTEEDDDAPLDSGARRSSHLSRCELAWGHDLPSRTADDLLLLLGGGAGDDLLLLDEPDFQERVAASTMETCNVLPDVIAREGVLLERACNEVTRGLLTWIAMAVGAQAASRRAGQRAGGAETTTQDTSEELVMSVFVLPCDGNESTHSPSLVDLLEPLPGKNTIDSNGSGSGSGGGGDRRARLVPRPPTASSRVAAQPVDAHLYASVIRREEEALGVLTTALTRWHTHHRERLQTQKTTPSSLSSLPLGHLCVQMDRFVLHGDAASSPRGPHGRPLEQPLAHPAEAHRGALRVVELGSHVLCDQDLFPDQADASVLEALDIMSTSVFTDTAAGDASTDALCAYVRASAYAKPVYTISPPLWIIDATSPRTFLAEVADRRSTRCVPKSCQIGGAASAAESRAAVSPAAQTQTRTTDASPPPPLVTRPGSNEAPSSPSSSHATSLHPSLASKTPLNSPREVSVKLRTARANGASRVNSAAHPIATTTTEITKITKTKTTKTQTTKTDALKPSLSAPAASAAVPPSSTPCVPRLMLSKMTTPAPAASAARGGASLHQRPFPRPASASATRQGSSRDAAAHTPKAPRPASAHASPASSFVRSRLAATTATSARNTKKPARTITITRTPRGSGTVSAGASASPRPSGKSPRGRVSASDKVNNSEARQTAQSPKSGGDFCRTVTTGHLALEENAAAAHVARMAAGREKRKQQDAAPAVRTWSPPPVVENALFASPRDTAASRHASLSLSTPRGSTRRSSVVLVTPEGPETFTQLALEPAKDVGIGGVRSGVPGRATRVSKTQKGLSPRKTTPRGVLAQSVVSGVVASTGGVRSVSPAAYQRTSTFHRSQSNAAAAAAVPANARAGEDATHKPITTVPRKTALHVVKGKEEKVQDARGAAGQPLERMQSAKPLRPSSMRATNRQKPAANGTAQRAPAAQNGGKARAGGASPRLRGTSAKRT